MPSNYSLAIVQLLFIIFLSPCNNKNNITTAMTWSQTWKDILNGGSTRWKINDIDVKKRVLDSIIKEYASSSKHLSSSSSESPASLSLKIFCPLAGDDQFVHYAWSQGHYVTAIDIVPDAVQEMRKQFCYYESSGDNPEEDRSSNDIDDWTMEESSKGTKIWKHKSGRATLYEGDVFENRPELHQKFDIVYDKDSFGALQLDMRPKYCQRLSEYTKNDSDAYVYVEVKYKENEQSRSFGPPFHIDKDDLLLESNFGKNFDYLSNFGQVYDLPMNGMSQTAHVLKKKQDAQRESDA